MFRSICVDKLSAPETTFRPGPVPMLQWLQIAELVVDSSYQRDIGRRGTINIKNIVENFDWSKFAPVIVAPVEGGKFAIVDGQHRTTAAMLRGIERVPCQVVQADRAQQAAAYSAVNGNVTRTTPQQLFHARVAAGEDDAVKLLEVCSAAGVEIVRRNLAVGTAKKGQTQAVACLSRCLNLYGQDTLITALQCITQTGDGNPGMVRATIIEGLCVVLKDNLEWRDAGEKLLRAMDDLEFADLWEKAIEAHSYVLSPTVLLTVVEAITEHLQCRLSDVRRQAAAISIRVWRPRWKGSGVSPPL